MPRKPKVDEIKGLVGNVEGWLTDQEGETLYRLANSCAGKGAIVEIGSWKGKSTVWLARGARGVDGAKVYAIDPHTGSSEHRLEQGEVWTFEEFKRNIRKAQVDDIVVPIVRTSEEAATCFDSPIGLIFVDGAHDYNLVKVDFETWFPKVVPGGIMAFHDTRLPGPREAVAGLLFRSRRFKNVRFVGSLTFGTKVSQNTLAERFRNRYVLLWKNLYDYASRLGLPNPVRVIGKKLTNRMT